MTIDHPLGAVDLIDTPITGVKPARIFAGLKIEAEVARELAELARPLERYGARLVPKSDIHLTLVPPWNESHIGSAIETLRIVASGFNRFLLTFEHLGYGPSLRYPRLLWADCVAGSELKELQTALMAAYGRTDTRQFRPHVTLARILQNGRAAVRNHPIDQPLSLTQCVASVELFQSPLKGQSGYRVLASLPLGAGLGIPQLGQSALTPATGVPMKHRP